MCHCVGPVLSINTEKIEFGNIAALTPFQRSIEVSNESPIPALLTSIRASDFLKYIIIHNNYLKIINKWEIKICWLLFYDGSWFKQIPLVNRWITYYLIFLLWSEKVRIAFHSLYGSGHAVSINLTVLFCFALWRHVNQMSLKRSPMKWTFFHSQKAR